MLLKFCALLSLFLIPFFAFERDLNSNFTQFSDSDSIYVGQAALLNDGEEQTYFDHPGFLYTQSLAGWLQFGKAIGALKEIKLSEVISNDETFGPKMAALITFSRLYSIPIALLFCFGFSAFTYGVTRSTTFSFLSLLLIATSPGLLKHTLIMRAELASSFACMAYAFLLVMWLRSVSRLRSLWAFLCGFVAFIALLIKVQALIPLLILSFLGLLYATRSDASSSFREDMPEKLNLVFIPFCVVLVVNILRTVTWHWQFYHILAVAALWAWFWLMKKRTESSNAEIRQYAIAFVAGLGLGTLLCFFGDEPRLHHKVFFFYESLEGFQSGWARQSFLRTLIVHYWHAFSYHFSPVEVWLFPHRIFNIFIFVAFIQSFRTKDRGETRMLGVTIFCLLLLETFFMYRNYYLMYFIYVEWIWIFALWLVPKTWRTRVPLFILLAFLSYTKSVFNMKWDLGPPHLQFIKEQIPSNFCHQSRYTPKMLAYLDSHKVPCATFILGALEDSKSHPVYEIHLPAALSGLEKQLLDFPKGPPPPPEE